MVKNVKKIIYYREHHPTKRFMMIPVTLAIYIAFKDKSYNHTPRRKRRYLLHLTTFLDGIGLFEETVHWFSNRHMRFLRAGLSYVLYVKVMKT